MLEDSLMESGNRIGAKSKYWSIAALLFDCGLLLALIVWPLLHPQALPLQVMAPLLVAPLPPPALPIATPRALTRAETLSEALQAPSRIPIAVQAPAPAMDGPRGVEGLADNGPAGL